MTSTSDHAPTDPHAHRPHEHASHEHTAHEHPDGENMTDLLELDAEVLDGYWSAALDWVRDAAAPLSPARVLDLGAGTGTGALGLARRLPAAAVTAVDIEAASLARLRQRAVTDGLSERVTAVEADLDAGWPDLGILDLTWASMSLHHMADPAGTLRAVRAATRDGGLIAVAEFPEPLRFLPVDLGTGAPGFEERVTATLGAAHAEQMPSLGTAWAPRLTAAGWQVVDEHDFPIDLNPPEHPKAGQYARAWFSRLAQGLADRLEPADGATLDALVDADGPHSLLHRGDLHIRGIRTVTLARRPG